MQVLRRDLPHVDHLLTVGLHSLTLPSDSLDEGVLNETSHPAESAKSDMELEEGRPR